MKHVQEAKTQSRKGAAEWFWMLTGIIIALAVTIFLLVMFFDFGEDIRTSFDEVLGVSEVDASELIDGTDDGTGDEITTDAVRLNKETSEKDLLSSDAL